MTSRLVFGCVPTAKAVESEQTARVPCCRRGFFCLPRWRRKIGPTRVRRVSPIRAIGEPYQYLRERGVRVEHRQKIFLPVALFATAFAASDRHGPLGQIG